MAKNRKLSAQARARLRNRGGQFAKQNGASFFRVDDIMRDVTDQVTKDLAERLTFWAKNIKTNAERRAGLREVNSTISRETMSFVLKAYENRGAESTNPGYRYEDPDEGSPRQFRRYSNGAMLRALSDPNNYVFSNREFSFINFEIMDTHAKQWYRLNFGTKDRPGDSPSGPNMNFMGVETSRKITLDKWQPSNYVSMPKGYWSKTFAASTSGTVLKRGRGAFYPASLSPVPGHAKPVDFRRVRGIEGKHFLDEGAIFINKRYPELLEDMVNDWMKRGL